MERFRKGDRVIIRGVIELAGLRGKVVSVPSRGGAAWILLEQYRPTETIWVRTQQARYGTLVSLFPMECDLEK